jgi:hypothetical protein
MIRGLTVVVILCTALSAKAQRPDSLPSNPVLFFEQLDPFFNMGKQDSEEELFKDLQSTVNTGIFSPEQFEEIVLFTNQLLKLRLPVKPFFTHYFTGLLSVKKSEYGNQRFSDWHEILQSLVAQVENRNFNALSAFLEFSPPFFENKILRNGGSAGTSWLVSEENSAWIVEGTAPVLIFENVTLTASRKDLAINIYETGGKFYPVEQRWKGVKGEVFWERFNLGDAIKASLDSFELDVTTSQYTAENVSLSYPEYFGNKIIQGRFSDKLVLVSESFEGSFPQFESYDHNLAIRDLGERINYKGGFKLSGNTIVGYGGQADPGVLSYFKANGQKGFICTAENFKIRAGERISGERVEIKIFLGEDSIYHPSVDFRFDIPEGKIIIKRADRASDANPFYSSYHQVQISASDLVVYPELDSIIIGSKALPILRKEPFEAESFNFFSNGEYDRLKAITSYHPLTLLVAASKQLNASTFSADYYASLIKSDFTSEQIKTLLFELIAEGYIRFDLDANEISVLEKTFHFVNSASNNSDYDLIQLTSSVNDNNAVIRPGNYQIQIEGINQLELSQKNRVGFKTSDGHLDLGKNRNMRFKGTLFAGLTQSIGDAFDFDYETFRVKMDSISALHLFTVTGDIDKNGFPIGQGIFSTIEQVTGDILIDAPANKSGREHIPFFPALNTTKSSFVYYEEALDSAYRRDSFYFELFPFSLNYLAFLKDKDLAFPGNLYSASIFPTLQDTLELMPDRSLGMDKISPEAGWPAYLNRGIYKGEILLDQEGLKGEGQLKYLMAQLDAEDFVFAPTWTSASAEEFNLTEIRKGRPTVPRVLGKDVAVYWKPYGDSLQISPKSDPFIIYQGDDHTLEGSLVLTPEQLKGAGILEWSSGLMESESFHFGPNAVQADTTSIAIKIQESGEVAIASKNMAGLVDFDELEGNFISNDSAAITELPYNQYTTSLKDFDWDIASKTINFTNVNNENGWFESLVKEQEGLKFEGANALYDLVDNSLKIEEVPAIISADAFIIPDSGKVTVLKDGFLPILNNAKIIADTSSQYHLITEATVEIFGRKKFTASGNYRFDIPGKEQSIFLEEIIGDRVGKGAYSQKAVATRARAEILEGQDFYIDAKIKYNGEVFLDSEKEALSFKGFGQLISPYLFNPSWFALNQELDKNNPIIPIDRVRDQDGAFLRTGIFLSKSSGQAYYSFLNPLEFRGDRVLFAAEELVDYIPERDEFVFGDSTRIITNQRVGNRLVLSNKTGEFEGDGRMNIGTGMNYVQIAAAGIIKGQIVEPEDPNMISAEGLKEEKPKAIEFECMTGVNFFLPDALKKIMVEEVLAAFDANIIVYLTKPDFFKNAAYQIFPSEPLINESIEAVNTGYLEIPEKANPFLFLFSNLQLKWDEEYQSLFTKGKLSGMASIGGVPFNKNLETYIEFIMPGNEDDRMYIYFKLPDGTYYFFGYRMGILSLVSNSIRFMDAFRAIKVSDTIIQMPDGETYEMQEVDPITATRFLRRIQLAMDKK